jgi:hypothetical protein
MQKIVLIFGIFGKILANFAKKSFFLKKKHKVFANSKNIL